MFCSIKAEKMLWNVAKTYIFAFAICFRYILFYIQIKQGTLGPNATIIDEPEWKEIKAIPNEILLSDKVSSSSVVYDYGREVRVEFYKNEFVYAVTYDQKTIYLDDLDSRPNQLLTGVRFQQIDNDLRLEIRSTTFDYISGQLKKDVDASSWSAQSDLRKSR